jgi:hypothetical protein
MSIRGNGLSDIGRFSLPRITAKGTRQNRARGLFEHEKFQQSEQITVRDIPV